MEGGRWENEGKYIKVKRIDRKQIEEKNGVLQEIERKLGNITKNI